MSDAEERGNAARVIGSIADGVLLVDDVEGLWIAAQEQSLIFEKFYRADANMTRGVSGSGLGPYISRELVNVMGGAISVQSELGKGSTFLVRLPFSAEARPA